ncbi:hypothetical protein [Sphingomonas sp. PAMC 26617]|uniref:hypothetical protein n=1 Tax=Sphingomonas sp. PAMC 26617 TaxID=1112216 RepID=UPI0002886964|nr:hypothetical protein [Sphingomonas sp. PAMC 26617]
MTIRHAARLRCPVCGNPDWHSRIGGEECTHCGLQVDAGVPLAAVADAIRHRLADGVARPVPGDRWALSPGGWRNAAWRFGHVLAEESARPAEPRAHAITLAIMTQPGECAAAASLIAAMPGFVRRIVLVDASDAAPWRGLFATAEVHAHPLDGDFARQRNRLQALAGTGWVLQLDSDERPDAVLLDNLGWLVEAADRDDLRSLGLARRNLVDGKPSALFPDIQYRLNRAEVRFAGLVHERPVVPFAQTSLALCGAIEHRLAFERVRARTRTYAAMSPDGARPEDEARLLRPYDAIADR